jgi:hypothetical protein
MSTKRLEKSLNERIYLMAANQVAVDKWEFKVRAQSLNVYEQYLTTNSFSCSCIDQKKNKHFCKHLLFLIVRVAPKRDIAEQLITKKTDWNEKHFNECSPLWVERLKSRLNREEFVKSQKERTKNQKNKVVNVADAHGQDCSICFEVMNSGEDIACCEAMCKNFFHNDCIKQWFASGHDTCPLCRTKWKSDKTNGKNKNKSKKSSQNSDDDSEEEFYDRNNQLDTLVERNTKLEVNFLEPNTLSVTPSASIEPSITSTSTSTTVTLPSQPLQKQSKSPKEPKAPKPPKAPKEPKPPKEPKAPKEPKEPKAPKEPKQPKEPKASKDSNEVTKNKETSESEEKDPAIENLTEEQVEEIFFNELRNFIQEKLGKTFEEILLERLLQISGLQLSDLQTNDEDNANSENPNQSQIQLSNYQIFNVVTPTNIQDFCESKGIPFTKGKILHELVRQETVYADRDLIVFNKHSGIMYTNDNAKHLLKLNTNASIKCKPSDFPDHRVFIHSKSANRKLIPGQSVFIKN